MRFEKDYGREISFRDLFFHLLYRWRSILAAALIGAVLLGGYTWLSNRSKSAVRTVPVTAEDSAAETEEPEGEPAGANIRVYRRLIDETEDYFNRSVLMRLNPYAVWKATAVYSVIPEEAAGTEASGEIGEEVRIAAAYPSLIYDNLDTDRLEIIYEDADPKYIREAVTALYVADTGTFTVEAVGLTKEMAAESLACFDEAVMKTSQGDIQRSGKHSVARISDCIAQGFDPNVLLRQNEVLANYNSYVKVAYPDGKPAEEGNAAGQGKRAGAKKSRIFRFAVIGFIAAAFLMICLYGMLYLLSRKLRKARELTDQFGVPVYGQLNHTRARRPGKGPDSLIEKWEFRKTKTDREAVLENTCALVREHSGEGGVLLTGTLPTERIQALADSMKERLGDAVPLTVEGSFLKNPRVIAEAAGASAVIIAEEQYVSELDEVRRMLELLKIGNAPASGAVVI